MVSGLGLSMKSKQTPQDCCIGGVDAIHRLVFLLGVSTNMTDTHAQHAPTLSPDQALQELLAGNRRFAAGIGIHPHQSPYRRAEVAPGQHPFAVVIGCSDSRVAPEIIFDCGLGDLFEVRTAGHAFDDAGYASVQYVVEHLGVQLIVVLGHSDCGAIKAVINGVHAPGHLGILLAGSSPRWKRPPTGPVICCTTPS